MRLLQDSYEINKIMETKMDEGSIEMHILNHFGGL